MRADKKVIFGMLIILGFALYAFNLANPLFWDDTDWIVNNPAVHHWSWDNLKFIFTHDTLAGIGLRSNYYRPFLFFTFLLNYLVGGSRPWGYHLINNALHIANALLVFSLLARWLANRRAAAIAAFIFLIHPLQTEAVTYISGRGDPLWVFFTLLGIGLMFREKGRPWLNLSLAAVCQILAMLSRETAFLFPVYLTVSLMTFRYRLRFWPALKRALVQAWPYYLISLGYGLLRLTVLNFQNTLNFYQQANIYADHLSYRLYTFLHVLLVYYRLLIWPTGLHMDRELLVSSSIWQIQVWPSLLLLAGLFYLVVKDFNRSRVWFFALGIFFINLVPTSGVVPINGLLYEHWLYFSIFGLAALAGVYLVKAWDWSGRRKKVWLRYGGLAVLLFYGGFWGRQAIAQNRLWGRPPEFWRTILRYEPNSVRALTNLANLYSDQGDLAQAEALLRRAIAVGDIQPQPYYNLGNILRDRGDLAGAVALYQQALVVDSHFPYAYENLAALYARQGKLALALTSLEKLAQLLPASPEVWYNIAQVKAAQGDRAGALAASRRALALLSPDTSAYRMVRRWVDDLQAHGVKQE